MPNEINRQKLAKMYGIHVRGMEHLWKQSKKGVPKLKICVPKDVMKDIDKRMSEYNAFMKKNRHASSIGDKLKSLTGKGTLSDKELKRRLDMKDAFNKVIDYIPQAAAYFAGCKGVKKIQAYAETVKKDFESMRKKDYVGKIQANETEDFNRNRYFIYDDADLPGIPRDITEKTEIQGPFNDAPENTYAERAYKIYKIYFALMAYQLSRTGSNNLSENLKTAEKTIQKVTGALNIQIDNIKKIYKDFQKLDIALKDLAPYMKEASKTVRMKYGNLRENYDKLYEIFTSIHNTSREKYMDSIAQALTRNNTNNSRYYNIDGITNAITYLSDSLNKFMLALGSENLKYSEGVIKYYDDMRNFYNQLKNEVKRLQDRLPNYTVQTNEGIFNEEDNKELTNRAEILLKNYAKLTKLHLELKDNMNNFLAAYDNWKKEKDAEKRRLTLFILFGLIGALSNVMKTLVSPYFMALLTQEDSPSKPLV